VRLLLVNGADTEIPTHDGWTPLLISIWYNHNDTMSLLLQHGACFLSRNNDGWTVLHLAVWYGDVATLDILASFNLKMLGPDATTKDGGSATDLLESRKDPPPDGFSEAFQRLLEKLRGGDAIDVTTETSHEDEESCVPLTKRTNRTKNTRMMRSTNLRTP
jgi:ankyrin repeat protein